MTRPTLIVMAAGIGSRYGGLKQVDPVGPSREMLVDYSAYDAMRAGCGRIVFIINEAMAPMFRKQVGDRIADSIPVDYVYQRLDDLPAGFSAPAARNKPWGTGHAIYCCRDIISEPFMVVNADDFYGMEAYIKVADFLRETAADAGRHVCMAGYYVENTLTEHGSVTRGVCATSGDNFLERITERLSIERINGVIMDVDETGSKVIAPGTVVSMNFWGFSPSVIGEFEHYLSSFLVKNQNNLESAEFYLPSFVNELIQDGKADVKVLETGAKWYGVTYREDKAAVQEAISDMIKAGKYPENLWRRNV